MHRSPESPAIDVRRTPIRHVHDVDARRQHQVDGVPALFAADVVGPAEVHPAVHGQHGVETERVGSGRERRRTGIRARIESFAGDAAPLTREEEHALHRLAFEARIRQRAGCVRRACGRRCEHDARERDQQVTFNHQCVSDVGGQTIVGLAPAADYDRAALNIDRSYASDDFSDNDPHPATAPAAFRSCSKRPGRAACDRTRSRLLHRAPARPSERSRTRC